MNSLDYILIGVIAVLAIFVSIQHIQLEKCDEQRDEQKMAIELASQQAEAKYKQDLATTQQALKNATDKIKAINTSSQSIINEPLKADCQDVLDFLIKHASST